jgi:type II secretion system (T2SS) protein M
VTLLQRVIVEKRALVIPLVIAIVANLAVYVLVVYPLGVKQAGAEDRAIVAAASARAAERELTAARALVSGKGRAEQEIATFYDKVLPADQTAARRMTYAALPTLAHKTHVTFGGRSTEDDQTGDRKESRLARLHIRMSLQGDYESLRQFIYELESAPEFVIIDDMTLLQTDPTKPLSLTLGLSAYYRLGPHGA